MLNTSQFNNYYLNEVLTNWVVGPIPEGVVSYNGYSLDNDEIVLKSLQYESFPTIDIRTFENPLTYGRTLTGYYFRDQKIIVKCRIIANSISDLESILTELKASLSEPNQDLIIKEENRNIKYKASLSNTTDIIVRDKYYRNRAEINLEFVAYDFGRDVNYRSQAYEGITTGTYEFTYENNGASDTYLQFIVQVNSASSLSEIAISNDSTGEEIVITRTFSASDYITINGEPAELSVILNPATSLDFSGVFPKLKIGHNVFTMTTTSTSHDIDLIIKTKFTY